MASRKLVEIASNMIRDNIQANIVAALAEIETDRVDDVVSTDPPQNYFYYENANAYRTPAVFIIAKDMDFRKEELGANFIDARIGMQISVVVEDRAEDYLTIKSWRYQAALHKILDQTQLEDLTNNVKIISVVNNISFSPVFTSAGTEPDNFRKEVLLDCNVYHYENF